MARTASGELIYTSPLGVTGQFYFCGIPLRLDTYQGCTHSCQYCFASKTFGGGKRFREEGDRENVILPADVDEVKRHFREGIAGNVGKSLERHMIQHGVPAHWGGMSDPFQPAERKYGRSMEVLDMFAKNQHPVVCSTKGTIIGEPEYLSRAKDAKLAMQVSLITLDDRICSIIEPLAPSVADRLDLIETLSRNGIWVAVRLQPMIVDCAIEWEAPALIAEVARRGAQHLVVEGYKPVKFNYEGEQRIQEATGVNTAVQYRQYVGELRPMEAELPTWRKWQYLEKLTAVCHEHGMTIGAADNQLHEMGDTICCCGIDNVPGFGNFWSYQSTSAAKVAKEQGVVTLEDMEQFWCPPVRFNANENWLSKQKHMDQSIKAFVQWKWNEGGTDSPEDLAHMRRSQRGMEVVYEWDADPYCLQRAAAVEQADMFGGGKAEA